MATTKEAKKPSKASTDAVIALKPLNLQVVNLDLVGDSPLLVHAFDEKKRREMLQAMQPSQYPKKGKVRADRDPWADYCDSMYWLTKKPAKPTEASIKKAKFGFPAVAFKAAAVRACKQIEGITMTDARGFFHIPGDYIEILGGPPEMHESTVKLQGNKTDLRYRGIWNKWHVSLPIRFNADVFTIEQIAIIFDLAGFSVGVGEYRPEKSGPNGMFHVKRSN